MNLAETLRGLWRRWYIVFPGIIIAACAAFAAWFLVSPGYERSATQLLLPGAVSLPEGGNPYLFLGGLSQPADVLVRAVGAENVIGEITKEHPDVEVEILRDSSTSGPVILITVTAKSDEVAEEVLAELVDRTAIVLDELQESEQILPDNRITVVPLTIDDESVLQQRSRIVASAGVGVVIAVLALLLAALVDGLSIRGRRRRAAVDWMGADHPDPGTPGGGDDDDAAGPSDDHAPRPPRTSARSRPADDPDESDRSDDSDGDDDSSVLEGWPASPPTPRSS
ncbi:hypothetical protein [Agromyces badenianii]|uniref:hypothetical protein n=1 Tax=Agromyces badenianii TaxID=2080742 RepID=UPI00143CEFFB|nr:hypothetical protein [Agromyces badenianii]